MASRQPRVFVHIGAMKTGTTYLQQLMVRNRDSLAEHGLLLPGESWAEQARAAHDVLRLRRGRRRRPPSEGMWDRLAGEMLAHEGGASVFSVEFLSFAGRPAVRRLLAGLPGAEVHVVLTVRDAGVVLPGLWQTHASNGGTASWPAFARGARAGAGRGPLALGLGQGARMFRNGLDVPRFLRVWGSAVPPDRLHVVTVPPPGSPQPLVWQRFASVLGVDPGAAPLPPRHHNPSLGYASADLLRRVNARLGRLPRSDYDPTIKLYLARDVLAARAGEEERPGLDEATAVLAGRWNRRVRDAVEHSRAAVTGDLADLPGQVRATAAGPLGLPAAAQSLGAAAVAVQALRELVHKRSRKLRRRGADVRVTAEAAAAGSPYRSEDGDAPGPAATRERWLSQADPVAAAVDDVTALTRQAMELHRQLQATRPGGK
jgi:hypothetical protein